MAAASARLLGAERIFMVDHHPYRLDYATAANGVEPIDFDKSDDPAEIIIERTDGRGADASNGRPVDALLANAGHGLGKAFLDQDWSEARHVIDTHITGTVYLVHRIGNGMRARREGRILLTGSTAKFMPGSFQAVYHGTKAFVDSFALALRNELKDSGVTITVLRPGPTDTEFFARADMLDPKVGAGKKADPAGGAAARARAVVASSEMSTATSITP